MSPTPTSPYSSSKALFVTMWANSALDVLRRFGMRPDLTTNKASRSKQWLYLLFVAALIASGRRIRDSIASRSGFPVVLTHGPTSAEVTEGVTILDVIRNCPSLFGASARYTPPWWLFTGNMQTLWNSIGDHTKTDVIPYDRLHLQVVDNGTLVLDTYPPLDSVSEDTPIVVILHGITGSSQEAYTRATVNAVTRPLIEGGPGYRAVVLNFRGCDGTPITSSRLYHAGETDDFRSVLLFLTQKYPQAPLYAVGFSMGASTLAVYLGQQGENTPLKASICVSNPWDWVEAAAWIETGHFMNRFVYGPVLAGALRTIFERNLHAFPAHVFTKINIPEVLSKRWFTIRWYDDRVTSKLFGFVDGHDYYSKTSSKQYMDQIKTPLLSLHATDDPIVAPHYLPWDSVQNTSHIIMASTDAGGHVGWFKNGENGFLRRWYTDPIVEFIHNMQKINPLPKTGPPILPPDENGLIRQADVREDQGVGFMAFQKASFTPTGRSVQGF